MPAERAAAVGSVVGLFPGPAGERLALIRVEANGGRAATLEEVVLGHLAAGRAPSEARAGRVNGERAA